MPSAEQKPPQPTANRLPMREKVAWGMGGFSDQLAANGLNNLLD